MPNIESRAGLPIQYRYPIEHKEGEPVSNVAIICPGQGGQEVGMGLDIIREPAAGEVFGRADRFWNRNYEGRSIIQLMFYGPAEELDLTANSQPGIYNDTIANHAAARAHNKPGFATLPRFIAGHSLGEYSAAVIAGAMSFEDGLKLVIKRGQLMQEACDREKTGMIPVRADAEQVQAILTKFPELDLCLLNTHDQVILGGPVATLERSSQWMKDSLRIRPGRPLNTAGAFHSRYMESAREGLAKVMEGIEIVEAKVPIIANMTADPITKPDELREEFINQLTNTVNWRGCVDYINQQHVDHIYTVGKKDTHPKMLIALIGGGAVAVLAGTATVAYEWNRHHGTR